MRARKRFGQNFLTDSNTISRIVSAIDPKPSDRIIEIGPGHGALTRELIRSGCRLDVVEIDRDLAAELHAGHPDLNIIVADILKLDMSGLFATGDVRVVGNLPYNISTPLLFRLFAHMDSIVDMHFMLQLEVVDRMVARHSSDAYGRLSIMAQYYCEPRKLFSVPAAAFKPRPKVMSSIIRLLPRQDSQPQAIDVSTLEKLVNQAFTQRRKTIRNALKGFLTETELTTLALDLTLRPENLSLGDYINCANFISSGRDA